MLSGGSDSSQGIFLRENDRRFLDAGELREAALKIQPLDNRFSFGSSPFNHGNYCLGGGYESQPRGTAILRGGF
jgi:hypothetical protein